jgi:hypothetical protein
MFTNAITLEGLDILEWRKRAENAEAEVERLKDARESAELRADDGWREAERLRNALSTMPAINLQFRSSEEMEAWISWRRKVFDRDGKLFDAAGGEDGNK